MSRFDLVPFDITTPKAKPGTDTAWTVPGTRVEDVKEFASCKADHAWLWAPTSGATTQSVHRTRCELKGGPFDVAGVAVEHSVSITAQVLRVNWAGKFVLIQAHCHDGNDPTFKGFIDSRDGGLTASFKVGLRTGGEDDPPQKVLFDRIDLKERFSVGVALWPDGWIEIRFQQGTRTALLKEQLSSARAKRPHVFHAGIYNQVDKGHASEPAGDGTELRLFEVLEAHRPLNFLVLTKLIDRAAVLGNAADRAKELQRITDLIDEFAKPLLSNEERSLLYERIKALKQPQPGGRSLSLAWWQVVIAWIVRWWKSLLK
ncbi:polysaccharide lyase family 7 protein [Pseudomonas sp. KNUC1026]|uniref:polysaccharide lyase family 7 protein n=1 Tax=Pseudomonas sp. KNUC1026 TaxID=2893890 RepID=UPI001F39B9EF|nr:polysaccharide lyase family 7 protein [Pseudomonas sp. KNUC1026]UFH49639.1 polysaccharide lyase family 7 protein [Pseudomonas sp. KNUC1026]